MPYTVQPGQAFTVHYQFNNNKDGAVAIVPNGTGSRFQVDCGHCNTCDAAQRLAERLGMSGGVQTALVSVFEQWDGGGMPLGDRKSVV